jgi:hypothetical protein
MAALGAAAHYLSRREPFSGFTSGQLIGTLAGQVQRGHCLFALDGLAIRGFLGWARLDAAVAERFATTFDPPPESACNGGDILWLLTAAADSTVALRAMIAACRALHPGRVVMGMRHKRDGRKVLIRQVIRAPQQDRCTSGEQVPSRA